MSKNMSTEDWKLERNLCRCCHSEGKFRSLSWKDEEVNRVYSVMLRNCLDIELAPVEGSLNGAAHTICDPCIARLRDAHSFKQQVLECEERFLEMYTIDFLQGRETIEVKIEIPDPDEADFGMTDDNISCEVKQEVKPKKINNAQKRNAKKNRRRKQKDPAPMKGDTDKARGYTPIGDSYKCSQCDNIKESVKKIENHIKMIHGDYRPKKCTHCPKAFKTQTQLTIHKLDEHNIDTRHKCNACDKVFNMKRQLTTHTKSYHMMGEKIKCSMCDYECYLKSVLRKHLFMHKTSKDFHCTYCKKSFMRKTTLQFHERIHTGDKRKVCAECGQAFVQKASLNYHMAKHHPEVKF